MAKKNWWLHVLKNIFTCESKPKADKAKAKGWRWFFGSFRFKQLPTTLPENSLCEAREKQRKHAVNVAKATAAAAEAAVAAAQAAAEVVRLTTATRLSLRPEEREIQALAAIKIQTAFRAFLARKALRALKGVVKMQAIARGQAVRRRVSASLKKHLAFTHQSKVVHAIKFPNNPIDKICNIGERSKLECKSERQWSESLFSREEMESVFLKKQEAAMRKERMKQYSFSHRERQQDTHQTVEETLPLRTNERHTCLRRQWAEENNIIHINDLNRSLKLRVKPKITLPRHDPHDQEVDSPFSHPRRSFCHLRLRPRAGHHEERENDSPSPSFPAYMAATESAKARMRSMSTPRQRAGSPLDACFEHGSPPCRSSSSNKLCSWSSSFNGERSITTSSTTMFGRTNSCQSTTSLSMEAFRQP